MTNLLNIVGPISSNAISSTSMKFSKYFESTKSHNLILSDSSKLISKELRKNGVSHEFIGPAQRGLSWKLFVYLCNNIDNYSIVHSYGGPLRSVLALPISLIKDKYFICRFNGYNEHNSRIKNLVLKTLEKKVLQYSDHIVFNSRGMLEDILHYHDLGHKSNLSVIPPGVPAKWFKERDQEDIDRKRKKIGIHRDTKIIGCCISPRPVKRLDRLFDIVKETLRHIKLKLIIVGKSKYNEYYKKVAREKGLKDTVIWAGHEPSENISLLYSLFDVTVLTSKYESFGQSITESYLCGTPCVAFDTGGTRDQIIHGKTGFTVKQDNIKLFSHRLLSLLSDSDMRNYFADRGKKYVKSKFTLSESSDRYETLLTDICSPKSSYSK